MAGSKACGWLQGREETGEIETCEIARRGSIDAGTVRLDRLRDRQPFQPAERIENGPVGKREAEGGNKAVQLLRRRPGVMRGLDGGVQAECRSRPGTSQR